MNTIKEIEVNNRFQRSNTMIKLKSNGNEIYLFPIKDIHLDTTFYYLYKSYQSLLVYGPRIEDEIIDITRTSIFIEEHNRYLMKELINNINKNDIGKYSSYYYINGLIVFKDAIEQIRDNIL